MSWVLPTATIIGAAGAVPGIEQAMQGSNSNEKLDQCIGWLARIEKLLTQITDNTGDRPVIQMLVLMEKNKRPFNSYGKAYTSLFVPFNSNVIFEVPGVGSVSMELMLGWNTINLPQGTQVTVPDGSPEIHVLYRASNVEYGNMI